MNRGRSALVLGIIVVLGTGATWLLLSGGGSGGSSVDDPSGDVVVTKGPKPPKRRALADLRRGAILLENGTAVFEASVEARIPQSLENETVAFRWEIVENDQVTWIVSANVDIERTASVVATQHDYRSSTIDQSLPGDLVIEGETVRVTLQTDDLEGFPSSFVWNLQTELDGDRTRSPSAVATDRIPNEGVVQAANH